uniref:Uncharacterized protein n=1 Tax=uncultured prokaryote TaxID=198431 RepID=A0A0H5PW45_9ZZZZ|nr:hypothetical protein [uncultured prokaryote]
MRVRVYDLGYKSEIFLEQNYRAFQHLENLVLFLREQGFTTILAQNIAVNVITQIAIKEKSIKDLEVKFQCLKMLFFINFNVYDDYNKKERTCLKMRILKMQVEKISYDFDVDNIDNYFLRMILDKTLILDFLRINYDSNSTKTLNYERFEREKRYKERVGVEITGKQDNKRVFVLKKKGKYCLTGISAFFDIQISFNERSFYKKRYKTKQAVKDTLTPYLSSIQSLMYYKEWEKKRKFIMGR